VLEEQRLNPKLHDRKAFRSGAAELDHYLHHLAAQHQRRGISTTYVLVDSDHPATILGYYSLSAAEVDRNRITPEQRSRLPAYPIPCFRMGKLACHEERRGQGLGSFLVGLSVARCLAARESIAAYALIVDARDDTARAFYEHYGFQPLIDTEMTLFLPLGK
jgi:GNAT superfamily N-acetyltransferase